MKAAVSFLKTIDEDDRVLILNHWDLDGTASAVIVSRIINNRRGRPADFVRVPDNRKRAFSQSLLELMRKEQINKLIILDMSFPAAEFAKLEGIVDRSQVLVIDHHPFKQIPQGITYINPRIEQEDVYTPASKVCWQVADKLGLDYAWIAGLGIAQDFAVETSLPLFRRLQDRYPDYLPQEITQNNVVKNSLYGKYSSVLNIKSYKDMHKSAKLAYKALMQADSLQELETSSDYQQVHDMYRQTHEEITTIIDRFEDEAERIEDKRLLFFIFSSSFHINSTIATEVSLQRPQWVCIVINAPDSESEEQELVNVSARCQSGRIDLGDLMELAVPEDAIEAGAEYGGHEKAAGASFPQKYLDQFKQNVLDCL